MEVSIDKTKCTRCGFCTNLAKTVFSFNSDGEITVSQVNESDEKVVRKASILCEADAININSVESTKQKLVEETQKKEDITNTSKVIITDDLLDNLRKLKELYDNEAITKEEFEELKSAYMRNKSVNIPPKKTVVNAEQHKDDLINTINSSNSEDIDHSKDNLISSLNCCNLLLIAIPALIFSSLNETFLYVFFCVMAVIIQLIGYNIAKKRGYPNLIKAPLGGCTFVAAILYAFSGIVQMIIAFYGF